MRARQLSLRREQSEGRDALPRLRERARVLAELGSAEAQLPVLAQTVVDVLAQLREGDARHGVRVEALSLPGRTGALPEGPPDAQLLLSLAHRKPGVDGLRLLRVDVRAAYRTYSGLQAWLAALGSLPLSFRRVWLEDQRVQLLLELIGS